MVNNFEYNLATYTVTSITSAGGTTYNDGELNWAINQSNTNSGADIIAFNLVSGTTVEVSAAAMQSITDGVTINGTNSGSGGGTVTVTVPNQTTSLFRIFHINAVGETVNISNMTIKGGNIFGHPTSKNGGGIFIDDCGTLNITNCTVSGSKARYGGGIGTIQNSPTTASVNITNSTISGNTAVELGGGINFGTGGGTLTVSNSTISSNSADQQGGGIYTRGTTDVNNSTIVNNSTKSCGGGFFSAIGTSTITDSTIANNITNSGNISSADIYKGGGVRIYSGTLTVKNTIICNNYNYASQTDDYFYEGGTLDDQGYNVVEYQAFKSSWSGTSGFDSDTDILYNYNYSGGDPGPAWIIIDNTADLSGKNLNLDTTLSYSGGFTETLAVTNVANGFLKESIGYGSTDQATDQRGYYRSSSAITRGAFQYGGVFAKKGESTSWTGGTDTYSTWATAITACSATAGEEMILAATAIKSENTTINKTITIQGDGATSTCVQAALTAGTASDRIFNITAGTVTLENMTIRYGKTTAGGGGISNESTTTVTDCILSNNESTTTSSTSGGGGIFNKGTLTVNSSTINDNIAFRGGGIYNIDSTLDVINSTIAGNTATGYGGGMYVKSGTVTIKNSTVSENNCSGTGAGGIQRFGGIVGLRNTIVANNTASDAPDCYGVFIDNGYNIIEYSSIASDATGGFDNATSILYNQGSTLNQWTQGDNTVSGSLGLSSTLALNGSTNGTYTLALETGSFAIGAIGYSVESNTWNNSSGITGGNFYDQRGIETPANNPISIGAYSDYTEIYYMAKVVDETNSGNWSAAGASGIWYTNTTGGTDATTYITRSESTVAPTAANSGGIIINNAFTVTVATGGFSIDQTTVNTTASIIVATNQTLTVANGDSTDLTVAGTGAVDVNGTLTATGTQIVYSDAGSLNLVQTSFSVGAFTAGSSTVTYDGAAQTVTALAYSNLVLGGSDVKTVGNTLDVNGTFSNTQAVTLSSGNLDIEGAASIGANITTSAAAGTQNFGVTVAVTATSSLIAGATGTIDLVGALTINDGVTLTVGTGDTGAISFGSTVNSAGGTGNLTINTDDTATLNGNAGTTPIGTLTLTKGNFATTGKNITAGAITVNGGTFNSTSTAGTWDLSGDVTIASGAALNATSGTFTVGGNWSNSGTFNSGSNTVTMDGSDTQAIGGTNSFYNLTVNNSHATSKVDASGSTSLAVSNDLVITDGIFKSKSDYANVSIGANGTLELSGDITVSGDWANNSGALTHSNNTVTFDGAGTSEITGSTSFYNLTCNTAGKKLTFDSASGKTQAVTGIFTLEGASGNRIIVNSTSSGDQADINVGTSSVDYVNVKDSNNTGTAIGVNNCVNSGNNFGWLFSPPTVTTNAASVVGTTSATLNGTVNANGFSTTVTFEYGTDTSYGLTANADPSPVTGSTDTAVSNALTGLSSDTGYHYRVKGVSDGGTEYGSDQTFTTRPVTAETKADGTWTTPATWVGVVVPLSTQNVTIKHVVTLNTDPTVQGLTIDSGKSLAVGANTLTAEGASDINGTVSISTGTFDANGGFDAAGGAVTFTGSGNLNLGGTVTSLGTFTKSTGTVTYDGAAQGVATANYHNLTFNGAGNKTLAGNIGISGAFTRIAGTFVHNDQTVTYNGADQSIPALVYDGLGVSGNGSTKTFADGITKVDTEISLTDAITLTGSSASAVTVQVTTPGASGTASRVFNVNASGETVNISNMTIKGGDILGNGGEAGYGGGILCKAGTTLNIENTTISGSKAERGGGIWNNGNVTFTDGTISGCTVTTSGGGILGVDNTTTILNSTISGNISGNYSGGIGSDDGCTFIIVNSTISNNVAREGGGIFVFGSTFYFLNTAIINNRDDSGDKDITIDDSGIAYAYYSWYGNVYVDAPGSFLHTQTDAPNETTAYTAGDLGSLADNGGQTQTMAVRGGSPPATTGTLVYHNGTDGYYFVDNVSVSRKLENWATSPTVVPGDKITTDQRSAARHDTPTMGAYEFYGDYTTNGNGTAWNTAANWHMYNGVSTAVPGDWPNAANSRSIAVNHDMNVNGSESIDQTTVASGKTLTVNTSKTLTVADGTGTDLIATGDLAVAIMGTLLINSGASVDSNGAFASSGTVSFNADTGADDGTLSLAAADPTFGTLRPGNGTVTYDGTDQTMVGQDYYKAAIEGGGVKTLSGNATVDHDLALTDGLIALGNNHLTLGTAATVSGSPSATSMIVTNETGVLKKLLSAIGSFTFPVGDNTGTAAEYSPATLTFTSGTFGGSAYAAIGVTNDKQPQNTSATDYLNRYWTVTQNDITSFSCATTFNYLTDDVVGTEANIYGAAYSGSAWTALNAVDAGNHSFSGTVDDFSDFTGVASYAVTYNANDATSGTAPSDQTKVFGVDLTLQTNTGSLARTGYTFNGWNTSADGSGTHYDAGVTYTGNAAVSLYAQWTAMHTR